MYQVKPTSVDFEIQIPNCMYKIKTEKISSASLHNPKECLNGDSTVVSFNILDDKIKGLINKSDMESLEQRQEILLEQLKKFKLRILDIRKKLNINGNHSQKSTSVLQNFNSKVAESSFRKASLDIFQNPPQFDIVINAHPKYVPYGLLGIKNVWKNIVSFNITVFSHSSLPEISAEALNFQKQLTAEEHINPNIPAININLIWKNCEHTEMICSSTMYKPIYGEINILRFLCRIGPPEFRYDFLPNANQTDIILDICYQLLRRTGSAQSELLKNLSEILNKQKYFAGNKISIADIAVSSSLKRISQTALRNLPENMKKWQNHVKNELY